MLLNLWSDVPFVYFDWIFHFFERKKLELELPRFFKEFWYLEEIFIITWPWNFSSCRIWIEVVNILIYLGVLKDVFYLNKLEFFQQLGYQNIYLFSGNKNKFIKLEKHNYIIVSKVNMDNSIPLEELFELTIEGFDIIKYKNILKSFQKLERNKLKKQDILSPYYIFNPIVSC